MRLLIAAPIVALSLALSAPSYADADLCNAKVLHPVAAVEDPSSMMKEGAVLDSVTQFNVDKKTGMREFCQHGGYCYPETITIDGKPVKSLKLTNCKIDKIESEDANTQFWSLAVNRSAVNKDTLRYADVNDKLSSMGMCNACASNAADTYVKHPETQCGQTVRSALEGNPDALGKLTGDNDPCH